MTGKAERGLVAPKEIQQQAPEASGIKRVLYGAWDGTKKALESQMPAAHSEKIQKVIDEQILPKMPEALQQWAANNRRFVVSLVKAGGVGVTAVEIVAAVAVVYGGVQGVKKLKELTTIPPIPDFRSPAMRQRDRYHLRLGHRRKHRHGSDRLARIASYDTVLLKSPDPRDYETLVEFAGALNRSVRMRPRAYRRSDGSVYMFPKSTRWKKQVVAILGEVLQQRPDIPDKYRTNTFGSWLRPDGWAKQYAFRFDEAVVRRRIAESMVRSWANQHDISDESVIARILGYWGRIQFMGVPRDNPTDMALFAARHFPQNVLSLEAKNLIVRSTLPRAIPSAPSLGDKIHHILHPAPVSLQEAHFALPVSHALQRLARKPNITGEDMYRSIQLERAIAALWTHRDDRVISQTLGRLPKEPNLKKRRQLLTRALSRLSAFPYRSEDASMLWQKQQPKDAASQIIQYWEEKKFDGLLDILSIFSD